MAMNEAQLRDWAYGQLQGMGFDVASATVEAASTVRATVSVGHVGSTVVLRYSGAGWVAEEHRTISGITNSLHDRRIRSKHDVEEHMRSLTLG